MPKRWYSEAYLLLDGGQVLWTNLWCTVIASSDEDKNIKSGTTVVYEIDIFLGGGV